MWYFGVTRSVARDSKALYILTGLAEPCLSQLKVQGSSGIEEGLRHPDGEFLVHPPFIVIAGPRACLFLAELPAQHRRRPL